jgi:hypothetical protein
MTTPELLYHYTTAEGLLGILQSGTLRATDVRHLNDRRELIVSYDLLVQMLQHPNSSINLHSGVGSSLAATMIDYQDEPQIGPFSVSFCDASDLLSQWRGYGRGGYALGFSSDQLRGLTLFQEPVPAFGTGPLPAVPVDLIQVAYDEAEHSDRISEYVATLPGAADDWTTWNLLAGRANALKVLASLKHRSFSEEREWRLLVAEGGGAGRLPERFRAKESGAIAPYLDIPINLVKALKKIVIGPGSYTRNLVSEGGHVPTPGGLDAINRLTKSHGLYDVGVRYSNVPYDGTP